MRKASIRIGAVYMAKVSGTVVPVRIINESIYGGWNGINEVTNRSVRIKSARRLRREI